MLMVGFTEFGRSPDKELGPVNQSCQSDFDRVIINTVAQFAFFVTSIHRSGREDKISHLTYSRRLANYTKLSC